ncbi:MAG: hypothetical protein LW714_09020 [Oxalobacteraceae bacterium]|jgi:hypothetical protein|nr:hypothetical protein [Oxalobacteraceae bacterium]
MAINIFSSRRLDGYRIMIPFVDNRSLDVINVSGAHDHKPTSYAANPPTLSIKMTVLAHAARDFAGQVAGRTVGLGIFNAAAYVSSSSLPCRVIAGSLGAVFGGLQAQRLAAAQIGTDNLLKRCSVVACTVVGATAGIAIASLGAYQPVVALAAGSALAITASLSKFCRKSHDYEDAIDTSKLAVFLVGTAATVSAVTVADTYLSPSVDLASKNIGVICEATLVEFIKSSLERCGPSVDRNTLNFNGKVFVSMSGLLPYLAATVLLNGYLSGLLQPKHDSHQFEELILPLIVGAIANGVRGACNARAVIEFNQRGIGIAKPDAPVIRPGIGPKQPEVVRMSKKIAIRFFLSICRNAVYDRMRRAGVGVVAASTLAQCIYGFFAQNRDLVYDLMKGEGWNRPMAPTDDALGDDEIKPTNLIDENPLKVADISVVVSSSDTSETSIEVSVPNSSETTNEVSTE